MKNQSKLLVIFTILLIAIPFLSAETSCTYVDTPEMQISLLNCNIPNTNPLCLTGSGGTVLTAPTISLLNCRIPNTNPLCLTGSGGTVLTAPTISLLNCRIPNTNPLCWFYYFGMSLISKNIILINGGIFNII